MKSCLLKLKQSQSDSLRSQFSNIKNTNSDLYEYEWTLCPQVVYALLTIKQQITEWNMIQDIQIQSFWLHMFIQFEGQY